MYMFPGHSYDQVLDIPVPIREWFKRRWNKQKEAEQGNKPPMQDLDTPLPASQRAKYTKK